MTEFDYFLLISIPVEKGSVILDANIPVWQLPSYKNGPPMPYLPKAHFPPLVWSHMIGVCDVRNNLCQIEQFWIQIIQNLAFFKTFWHFHIIFICCLSVSTFSQLKKLWTLVDLFYGFETNDILDSKLVLGLQTTHVSILLLVNNNSSFYIFYIFSWKRFDMLTFADSLNL